MTLRREDVQRILHFYGLSERGSNWVSSAAIDALCALPCQPPPPSREELEKIIRKHEEPLHQMTGLTEKVTLSLKDGLVNDLLSWASGQSEHVWCEHIQQATAWPAHPTNEGQRRWYLVGKTDQTRCFADDFMVCPICAAPRPTQAPDA